jgi:hypothetical protein
VLRESERDRDRERERAMELQGEGFGNCSGVMADAEVQRSEVVTFLNSKGVETEVVNRMLNR